jgi:hypothetical protein
MLLDLRLVLEDGEVPLQEGVRVCQAEFGGDEELDARFDGSVDDGLLTLDGLRRDGGNDGVNPSQGSDDGVAGRVVDDLDANTGTKGASRFR